MAKRRKPDQLDLDSSAAIKAGMSYGKYMATKLPVQAAPKQDEPSEYRRVCQYCGEIFYRYDQRERKYCSDRCRKNAEKARDRLRKNEKKQSAAAAKCIKTCAMCGKDFVASSWRNKYCGPFCQKRAQAERSRACQMRRAAKEVDSDELEI